MKYLLAFILISCAVFSVTSCKDKENNLNPMGNNTSVSKTFVLVAGAWQGAYVWQNVKTQLEGQGQKVVVVELPAHGDDNTSPANVSIEIYRDKVVNAINAIDGKVILVGHSLAGVVVSEVAEAIPDKLEKLIYVAAFVPANGQSLQDLAFQDTQSQLGPSLIPSQDMLTLDVKQENRINIFCQDGYDEAKALLTQKFRVEPAIPFTNKVSLSAEKFGKVDKYYIHTSQDHAIGPDLQDKMANAAGISKTYTLNSGHSPFLSVPDQLTQQLLTISK